MNQSLFCAPVAASMRNGALLAVLALRLSACGGNGAGVTAPNASVASITFLFRETLTDAVDGIRCSDRGIITVSQLASSFTGTLKQTGLCTGPNGSVDNSGSSAIAGSLSSGTTIAFQDASCQYQGRTVGDPPNGAGGTLSCKIQQAGHTFPFTGDWRFTSGVASVSISPNPAGVEVGEATQLSVALRDPGGNPLTGRQVTWMSSTPAVAAVDATGRVTGATLGSVVVRASSVPVFLLEEPQTDSASVRVFVIFTSVSSGDSHTCGVTTKGAGYCWGWQLDGRLGNNTPGSGYQTIPSPVSGGLTFTSISAGFRHTCGVTTDHAAYCWGRGLEGELGNGSSPFSPFPVAVAGGLAVTSISAGHDYTCAVSTTSAAYCWGLNDRGQLGNGTYANSATPVVVSGGLTFASISAGQGDPGAHTCAVTPAGAAYCWGLGLGGQLGRSTGDPNVPGLVVGGLTLTSVVTGGEHTCGVATNGAAYCWGQNFIGQLGNGTTGGTATPAAVLGGLSFAALTAGGTVTCGATAGGAAYCWGGGILGTGVPPWQPQTTPAAVLGSLSFTSVSANRHSCGITTTQLAYCWGRGIEGELGNGATSDQPTPVVVSGQR
jgi:alpha-tubulin suppressor-like RCC1 family protein